MKKIVALSAVVAIIAIGFVFFFLGEKKSRLTPAAFLPEDVLVCLNQKDLGRMLEDFKESHLGKTFAQIDLVRMAEDLGLPRNEVSNLRKAQQEGRDFLNGPVFNEFFKNDFSVALLPLIGSDFENPLRLEEHLLLIAKPEHGTQLINLLTSGFVKVLNQTNVRYGDYSIKRFQLEKDKTLFAVAIKDLVVMALDERVIHECVDRYDGKQRSLENNDGFQKLRASFKEPVFFSYFGLESLKKQMEMLVDKTTLNRKDILRDEFKKWNGLQMAGYGVWRETDRIKDKGVFVVDNEKLLPTLKNLYATAPEKNSTLLFVPQHVLAYYWTNTLDLPAYWKLYQEGSDGKQEKINRIRENAKRQFGAEIETILSLLDRECGLMIQDAHTKRFLPLPDFSIFVRLKDSRRFGELVRNFLKNNALRVQVQNYRDIEIISMAGLSQGGLLPVYAIHDHYFLVASSMAIIKEIVDTMMDGHGLTDNPDFHSVNAGLLEENNSICYIRVGDLMREIKGMVNWGRTIIAIQDQEGANRMEVLIDGLVNPLLDGLSMYSAFGLRSRIAQNQIIVESTTVIKK
jgi:hypothetical protein